MSAEGTYKYDGVMVSQRDIDKPVEYRPPEGWKAVAFTRKPFGWGILLKEDKQNVQK